MNGTISTWMTLLGVMGASVGCASAGHAGLTNKPGPSAPVAERDDEPACEQEVVTGTHIPRRVCRSERERDADREGARRLLHQRPNPPKGRGEAP